MPSCLFQQKAVSISDTHIDCNPFVADGIKVSVNVEENIKFNGLNVWGLSGCIISLFLLVSHREIAVLNSVDKLEAY